ncbi:helix-turn-helix transcriptional regulator [Nocardia sp. alder85J]|uniref:helix-turn-helix transcriptional regulator n=1 Tax=Nocardia sp. alder85J TaxID=2862949 RepID=UPI001CD805E2|nr:LuxR C-terminal-related transcriptional regulator [Nocardia sp. alder85J]MCX4097618.1 LuxR C-terminal-related transcriptional regulator [Nocardia sp. alder85J]
MARPARLAETPTELLSGMREVIEGPLAEIANRFSLRLADRCPHTALIIFTRECTGRPRKVAGPADLIERVTIGELDVLRQSLDHGATRTGPARLAGAAHRVWAVRDRTDTLLVLVLPEDAEVAAPQEISAQFGVVATSIRQQVAQASPDYLAESRAASSERARTITELTAVQEATLTGLLGTLRSADLDDRRARAAATEIASGALIALRAAGESDRARFAEPLTEAFARLHAEIDSLLCGRGIDLHCSGPADDRSVSGEIAYAARAMVRAVVLAFGAEPGPERIRVAWACDGDNLLIDAQEQAAGTVDTEALARQLSGRADAVRGAYTLESVPGWGSRVTLTIPLEHHRPRAGEHPLSVLNRRELEVLGHLTAGKRNRAIADALGITESTVKFHVARLLKKLDVATRGEAAVLGARLGVDTDHLP